jgi:hypothetical protein
MTGMDHGEKDRLDGLLGFANRLKPVRISGGLLMEELVAAGHRKEVRVAGWTVGGDVGDDSCGLPHAVVSLGDSVAMTSLYRHRWKKVNSNLVGPSWTECDRLDDGWWLGRRQWWSG